MALKRRGAGAGRAAHAAAAACLLAGCAVADWMATTPVRLPAPAGAAAAAPRRRPLERELAVLSYNVHGLSRVAARDDPAQRAGAIGWLARRYSVVLLQEDFETARAIAAQLPGRTIVRGNALRLDPRLIAAKLLLLPVSLAVPGFSPPYGAGLTTVLAEGLRVGGDGAVRRQSYSTCDGWFGDRYDCWASKGFLRVRAELAGGLSIDVYNTHLESGSSPGSVASRRAQVAELADAVERDSAGRAVILGGDLNLADDRGSGSADLAALRARLGLRETGARPRYPGWRGYEHLWVRDGGGVSIAILEAGEDVSFVSGDRALSDHPAIFARLAVAPAPAAPPGS